MKKAYFLLICSVLTASVSHAQNTNPEIAARNQADQIQEMQEAQDRSTRRQAEEIRDLSNQIKNDNMVRDFQTPSSFEFNDSNPRRR